MTKKTKESYEAFLLNRLEALLEVRTIQKNDTRREIIGALAMLLELGLLTQVEHNLLMNNAIQMVEEMLIPERIKL